MENMRDRMIIKNRSPLKRKRIVSLQRCATHCCVLVSVLLVLILLFGSTGVCAEELHAEGFAGTVASRTGNEVTLSVEPKIEFGRHEELCVYQKRDVIQVGGVTVKASWGRIGKIRISDVSEESANAVIVEELPDTAISVGDEVGRLPNTAPEIVSMIVDSPTVRPRHEVSIYIEAKDGEGDALCYAAETKAGNLLCPGERSPIMLWTAPAQDGTYEITIRVTDEKGGKTETAIAMKVPLITEAAPYKFVSTIGGNSRAPWQLKEVADVEIDVHGNMWVLDSKSKLLRISDPMGKSIGALDLTHGEPAYGVSPSKMLLDQEGFVYILDTSHETLKKLNERGSVAGTVFDGTTRKMFLLEKPSDVTFARNGDILVTDSVGGHIVAIDKKGRFVLLFSSQASGPGRLITPTSIVTDRYGDIYVLDSGRGKIAEFDSTFRFQESIPCPLEGGTGEILSDEHGERIFVLDYQKGSVKRLDADGKLRTHINPIAGADASGPSATAMALGMDGHVIIGTNNASIWEFDPDGKLLGTRGEENLGKVSDLAVRDDGSLLMLDTSVAQVKSFDRYGWLRGRFGEKGQYEGQFLNPARIAVDGEGNYYVFDDKRQCIQRFYAAGGFHKKMKIAEDAAEDLKDAVDIDVTAEGNIYILNRKMKRVFVLAREGDLTKIIPLTTSGTRNGTQIKKPAHIAVDEKGDIFVSDPLTYAVYKFHSDGTRINKLGGKGMAPGQFGKIVGLAVDKRGYVYVLLKDRSAVAKFAGDGRFIMEIPLGIDDNTPLRYPEALTVDSFGALHVFDSYYGAVFKFMQ